MGIRSWRASSCPIVCRTSKERTGARGGILRLELNLYRGDLVANLAWPWYRTQKDGCETRVDMGRQL